MRSKKRWAMRWDTRLLVNGHEVVGLTADDLEITRPPPMSGHPRIAYVRILIEDIVRTDDAIDIIGGPAIPRRPR